MTVRRPANDDGGFTLIELIVAAGLMSLVGVLVASTVVSGLRTSARGESRTEDAANAQRAMLQITADLRAADEVLDATGTRVVVRTRSTGQATSTPSDVPEQVTYSLSAAGDLVQTRQSGSTSTGSWAAVGAPRTSTLVRGVLQPVAAGRPLFRFLSPQDSQRQCLTGATTGTLGDPVGPADLARVYSVDVWLSVNSAPRLGARPLVVPGGVVLANNKDPLTLGPAFTTDLGLGQGC